MKRASSILFSLTLLASLGCHGTEHAKDHYDAATTSDSASAAVDATADAATTALATTAAAVVTHETEIGCGHCVYHMDGVDSCKAAVKVGDQIVLLQSDVDPHGLCAKPKKAIVSGGMQDGVFIASKVDIQE